MGGVVGLGWVVLIWFGRDILLRWVIFDMIKKAYMLCMRMDGWMISQTGLVWYGSRAYVVVGF